MTQIPGLSYTGGTGPAGTLHVPECTGPPETLVLPPDEEQQRRKLELVQAEARKLADLAVETAISMTYQNKMDPAFVAALLATITAVHIKNST